MKIFKIFIVSAFLLGITQNTEAQIWKRIAKHAEDKVKSEAERRADKRIDKGIDKTYDGAEDAIDGKGKTKDKKAAKKNDAKSKESSESNKTQASEEKEIKTNKAHQPKVVWSKFDFVPGDTVIFEDSPAADEENGEFPSRWDLDKGQIEIANIDGENVLMFIDGMPRIVPYLKNSKEDYLPEVFTIEFDYYKPKGGNRISVYLYDYKNQKNKAGINRSMYMDIGLTGVKEKLSDVSGKIPERSYSDGKKAFWTHVSIAFTKGKLKVYINDTRVINIPHYSGNPTGLSLQAYWANLKEDKAYYFKNIRIAKGGVKYYKRVLSDGKIIVNGIKFDINKATLKPESMGPINRIYKLMQKQPDLKFSVEGHTDADGNDKANMTLSKARGKAVMEKLISMGIDKSRLKYNGFGESKPIDNNATPEGKANNRRVEFVKY